MKQFFFLILIFLCGPIYFGYSQNSWYVQISLSDNRYEAWGIPNVLTENRANQSEVKQQPINLKLNSKDSIKHVFKGMKLSISPIKKRHFSFWFSSEQLIVKGSFYIPKYKMVEFIEVTDPVTLTISKLVPYDVYRPVRQGKWEFMRLDGTKIAEMEYQTEVMKKLKL
jgi:hypothetical protein